MTASKWFPSMTARVRRPEKGQRVAYKHAVWLVTAVDEVAYTEEDEQRLRDDPGLRRFTTPPYRVTLRWQGGAFPDWPVAERDGTVETRLGVAAFAHAYWHVYTDGRWPQCSCCGEPMPCRAELRDREVKAEADKLARFLAIPEGACWGCAEPITSRQKWQAYPGENLDLPGGQEARFHTRGQCRRELLAYEGRWLAVDPRRERVYTWPTCQGWLVVHADGSSECEQGPVWPHANISGVPHPDCRGHLTHDHGNRRACEGVDGGHCPRGCTSEGHNGTWVHPDRPDRHP